MPTATLREMAVELVGGERVRLWEEERDKPLPPSEAAARALAFARVDVVRNELERRGEELPEQFVLAYRRWMNATTDTLEPTQSKTSGAATSTEAG
jgi:Lon protease-like protein